MTSTTPIIDDTDPDDFSVTNLGQGDRGVFDWEFYYRWLPKRPEDEIHPEKPAPYPVMLGGVFAIRKEYFFYLGGYDEQLQIWNGENYEVGIFKALHLRRFLPFGFLAELQAVALWRQTSGSSMCSSDACLQIREQPPKT